MTLPFLDAGLAQRLARDGFAFVDLMPAKSAAQLQAMVGELDRSGTAGLSGAAAAAYSGRSFRHPDAAFRRQANAAVGHALAPHVERLLSGYTPILAGYLIKPAGAEALEIHQDWTMTSDPSLTAFNIWCPLVDVDEDRAALALVPGSHRVGSHISGPGIDGYWQAYTGRLKEISTPARLRAGQAVVYDSRTLHWSSENRSGALRPVATMTCIPSNATAALFLPDAGFAGERLQVVDMSGDGYVEHGALDCLSGEVPRPRLAVIANPNRPIPWPQVERMTRAGAPTSPESRPAADDAVLIVSGLSKKYCRETSRALRYAAANIVGDLLPPRASGRLRHSEFLALEDVNLELRRGEALAVLGVNGAGKTTLLKTISGLLKPTRGCVRVRGSVGAIIELGTGLSPLLTGRENVRLGASLAGLPAASARRLLDDVVAFAELDGAIDMPFQSYSSGMKARLAYALATHLKPDLLLVDEVLAVGDIHFQRKCVEHMLAYLADGGSLLFVSHNVFQIQAVCNRGLLLDSGRTAFEGTAIEAVSRMFEMRPRSRGITTSSAAEEPVSITSLVAEPIGGNRLKSGGSMRIRLGYQAREAHEAIWGFSIWTEDLATCVTGSHDMRPRTVGPGKGELSCVVPGLSLVPGRYALRAVVVAEKSRHPLGRWGWENEPLALDVGGGPDLLQNAQMMMKQLVTVDVAWE